MDTAVKTPISQRINLRMIVFFGVLLLLVGTPVYIYLKSMITGGIEHTSEGVKVDLKAMSVFPFDQVNGTIDDIPKKWRDLDGQTVIATGEMWDSKGASQYVDQFDLVYSIAKCCFSGPPQVQHFVHAKAAPNANIEFYSNLVRVKGTLHIKVVRDQDKVSSVYSMDVESVEPM